jgi:hypothetical protein
VGNADVNTSVYGYPATRADNADHTDAMWAVAGQDLPWLRA